MNGLRPAIGLILLLTWTLPAMAQDIFNSFETYYGEKRLSEYIIQYNQKTYAKDRSLARLKQYFPSPDDQQYLDREYREFKGKYAPSAIYKDGTILVLVNRQRVAKISNIDPVARSIKINGQDITLAADRPLAQIHQEIMGAIDLPKQARNYFFPNADAKTPNPFANKVALFVLLPIGLDIIALSFERTLSQLVDEMCRKPSEQYSRKNPYESHWLLKLKDVLMPHKQVVRNCDYWVQLQLANGSNQTVERLEILCVTGKRALGCLQPARYTPAGIKKNN